MRIHYLLLAGIAIVLFVLNMLAGAIASLIY